MKAKVIRSINQSTGWLDLEGIDVLPWCLNSPDMYIVENLWDHLEPMVRARDPLPKNQEDLWLTLKEEWENIDHFVIGNLTHMCKMIEIRLLIFF